MIGRRVERDIKRNRGERTEVCLSSSYFASLAPKDIDELSELGSDVNLTCCLLGSVCEEGERTRAGCVMLLPETSCTPS